jgi:hypothetical protein
MKKIKILSLGLLVATTMVSCDKEGMDISPTTRFTEERALVTVGDLDMAALGLYGYWSGENTMYINAILSDEVRLSTENRGQGQFEHKWTYSSGTESFAYSAFYSMIRAANKVIEAAPRITAANAADQAVEDNAVAEATALRAVAHFELLQRFGPAGAYNASAPGVTVVQSVLGPSEQRPRNTVGEVVAAIEADLAAAKANAGLPTAPYLYQGSAMPTGYGNIRISKAFVSGMQARVALYKNDWTNAATFATEAINTSGKTLATGATFRGIWTDANDAEVFLRLRRTGAGVGTLWQDTNDDIFFEPSEKIKQQFNRTTDVRWQAYFIDPPPPSNDTMVINKFFSSSRGPKIVDVKLMRVAEMYLIRAEARAEANDLAGASADINTLRAARISGYTPITYTDKAVAIADILNERFKELAWEGFRFFDLKRRGLAVNRLLSDVTSTQWQSMPAGNFRFVLPIPQSAIFANPNQSQNPGY